MADPNNFAQSANAELRSMSDVEYGLVQQAIIQAGDLLAMLDLPAFIDRANVALAVGPVLNPTLYMRGVDRLEAVRDMATAALRFRNAVERLRELVAADGKTVGERRVTHG